MYNVNFTQILETKKLAKDTEKYLILLSWGCESFLPGKSAVFKIKVLTSSYYGYPKTWLEWFFYLIMSANFLPDFKALNCKVSSNRGLNEHPNINTKPLNCPVHIELSWNPKLFKRSLHKYFSSHSVYMEMQSLFSLLLNFF